jgi:hypothetical protein
MLRQEQHNIATANQQLMAAMIAELGNVRIAQGSSMAPSVMASTQAAMAAIDVLDSVSARLVGSNSIAGSTVVQPV